MTIRRRLDDVLTEMSEERLKQVLDFAEFIAAKEEDGEWGSFILRHAESFYEGDESNYTLDDIKEDSDS